MIIKNFTPFFYPPDSNDSSGTGTIIENKELSKDDAIEFMGEDDKEEVLELESEKKIKSKDKDKEDDDKELEVKDELKELEEELEDEDKDLDEDELELVVPARKKEILAKYPTLFKDFPYLEKAYYREQKYAELLPTISDAENAVEKSEALDNYEAKLLQGSTEDILRAIKSDDQEAFNRIVDNYLPSLEKVDENAYYHVIGNIIKHTIASMVGEKDENLTEAARLLNKYVFGKAEYDKPTRLSKVSEEEDKHEEEINEREQEFTHRQLVSVQENLDTRVTNILKSTIDKNIDPKDTMSDYVKKHAIREAEEHLDELIGQDTRFRGLLDKLWARAIDSNFSEQSIDRIRSAYLSKAKTLLPSVIKKSRNEALRGLGKKITDDTEEDDYRDKKGPLPVGKTRSSSSSSGGNRTDKDKAREIPKGMRSIDYLMQD